MSRHGRHSARALLAAFLASAAVGCPCCEAEPFPDAGPGPDRGDSRPHIAYADLEATQHVVSIGDSIAAGYGVPLASSFGHLFMQNDDEAYPAYAGLDLVTLRPGSERFSLAVAQAGVSQVQRLQLENLPDDTTLVIGSVGTVDYLAAVGEDAETAAERVSSFGTKLGEVLAELRDVTRFGALPHIYLLNIADPTDGEGAPDGEIYGEAWPAQSAILEAFNAEIASRGAAENAHILDIHTAFLGHGHAHADPANPHHDSADPSTWFQLDLLHPNPRGHHEIRRLLIRELFGL